MGGVCFEVCRRAYGLTSGFSCMSYGSPRFPSPSNNEKNSAKNSRSPSVPSRAIRLMDFLAGKPRRFVLSSLTT